VHVTWAWAGSIVVAQGEIVRAREALAPVSNVVATCSRPVCQPAVCALGAGSAQYRVPHNTNQGPVPVHPAEELGLVKSFKVLGEQYTAYR
jgi:hypothetical protein